MLTAWILYHVADETMVESSLAFFVIFFFRKKFQSRDPLGQSFVNLLEIIWSYFQASQTPSASSGPIGLINLFLFPPICSDNSSPSPFLSSVYSDDIPTTPNVKCVIWRFLPFLSFGGSLAAAAAVVGSW